MLRYCRHLVLLTTSALFLVLRAYPQDLVQGTTPPKTWLAGKVINSVTRKPVSRALVRLTGSSRAMLTGPEGDFSFDDVQSGKVDIEVAKPGYFSADHPPSQHQLHQFQYQPYALMPSPYQVEVGPETGSVVLRLLPEATIFGTVRGDDGRPLPVDLDLLIPEMVGGKPQLRAVRENVSSDENGNFQIGSLLPGDYYLHVKTARSNAAREYPSVVDFPSPDAAPLKVAGGQRRKADVALNKVASPERAQPAQLASPGSMPFQVSGVLVDAVTRQPVREARVAITSVTDRRVTAAIITSDDGRFAFPGLAAGKYWLSSQRRGYLSQSFSPHDSRGIAMAVGPGVDLGNLVFRITPECTISGRISDEAGEPVRGARVLLYRTGIASGLQGPRLLRSRITDEVGSYDFGYLSAGKYFVAVVAGAWYAQRPAQRQAFSVFYSDGAHTGQILERHLGTYSEEQGWSPLDVTYPITFYPGIVDANAASPIAITGGESFTADIGLQPVPALHIRVATHAEVSTLDHIQIQSKLLDAPPVDVTAETRLLPAGEIDITGVPPGRYQVDLHDRKGIVMKTGELVASSSGQSILEHEVSLVPVTATVKFEGGVPPPKEDLELTDSKLQQSYGHSVETAGEIKFDSPFRPGSYNLSMPFSVEFIKSVSATGATVSGHTLEIDGSGPVNLDVTVTRGRATVNGVALHDGQPGAGVMVALVPADPVHNHDLFRWAQSDSDGSFTLYRVEPGKYTLLAIEHGWDLEWQNPAVFNPYLFAGEVLEVQQNGEYNMKVRVQ